MPIAKRMNRIGKPSKTRIRITSGAVIGFLLLLKVFNQFYDFNFFIINAKTRITPATPSNT
jgi:hypothetical protein